MNDKSYRIKRAAIVREKIRLRENARENPVQFLALQLTRHALEETHKELLENHG